MRSTPYELALESRAAAGPEEYRFRTADGVVSKDAFRPAELLALEVVEPRLSGGESVLVVDGNWGLLPTVLAHLAGSVTATETSARAAELCRRNARDNDADVRVELVADVADVGGAAGPPPEFDLVVYAPKPYDPVAECNQRIADALAALAPGRELLVAGGKGDGIRRYRETLADLAGEAERVRRSGEVDVYRATRPAGYDPPRFVEFRTLAATVAGHDCRLVTRPGLFSPGRLDRGTALLAETAVGRTGVDPDRVLDVACGYGPLGIALAREFGAETWFSDDSRVATACARRSCERSGVGPAGVVTADCLAGVEGPFDLVVTNPPTHAGEGVTAELFDGVRRELSPDGEFWLVYNETMDYGERLREEFGAVTIERRTEGYAVAVARR